MTTLDGFFRTPTTDIPAHPRLRDWKRRLDAGAAAVLELFRPDAGIGRSRPVMYVQFVEGGQRLPLEEVPWDDDLNTGLIRLHVRGVDHAQESERFALGLRAALRKAERDFGDGYFNAVLLEFITESDIAQLPAVAEVLKHAHANRPHRGGGRLDGYTLCREMIGDAIAGRAVELRDMLGYSEEESKAVLVAAIANYLDERFSVSSRRSMGLL